jgi:hypothetical protein
MKKAARPGVEAAAMVAIGELKRLVVRPENWTGA